MAFQTIELVKITPTANPSNPYTPTLDETLYDAELEISQIIGIYEWIHPISNQVFPNYTNILYGVGGLSLVSTIPYAVFKTMI